MLGSYPAMSLAQARSAALEIQIEAESGVDRVQTEEEAKARLAPTGLKHALYAMFLNYMLPPIFNRS